MPKIIRLTHLLLLLVLLMGCTPQAQPQTAFTPPPTRDIDALSARETALASTQRALFATATPTRTATPTLGPTATHTPVPPTPTPSLTPTPEFASFSTSVRILLHEDVAHSAGELRPFVAAALKRAGYAYTTTDGNIGTLKDKLEQNWDLVIIAAEMKANLQGEFLDMINKHVYQGGGLIMETWLLDKVLKGSKFNYMLSSCGVEVQDDYKDSNFRRIVWADPDHALLQGPNQGMSLEGFVNYWRGDIGDLLRKKPGSSAEIIASTTGSAESEGVLTSCFGGRVILQTFSSHDHKEEDMIPLWENTIEYSLQALYSQRQVLAQQTPDPLDAFKHKAQILVLKPLLWYPNEVPYLGVLTLGGVNVTAVNSFQGLYREMGKKQWDLIVLVDYQNEFLPDTLNPLRTQLRNGGAVVFEKTVLSNNGNYRDEAIANFLTSSGVQSAGYYTVGQRLPVEWLSPEHPLASSPLLVHLPAANRLGSLVSLLPDSQAELVAGVLRDGQPAGFLFTGYEGRLVMQTVQSSQYDPWTMFQAWEGYIDYALRQRMLYLEANP